MGFNWDPVSWVETAYDWTTGALDDAYQWTDTEVGKLAGWTKSEIKGVGDDVFSFVTKGLGAIDHVFDGLVRSIFHEIKDVNHDLEQIGQLAGSAVKWVTDAPDLIGRWITDAVDAFDRSVVEPLVTDVDQLVETVYHKAVAGVEDVAGELTHLADDVVKPLTNWVEHSGEWFAHEFDSAFKVAYDASIGPVVSEVDWLIQNVPQWIDWLETEGLAAVHLVEDAADWLAAAAEWSFDVLEGSVTDALGQVSPSNLSELASSTADTIKPLVDWLEGALTS